MSKIKSYFIELIYPFILIVLLGILFFIIIYWFVDIFVGYNIFNESDKVKRLDATIKILGTSISLTGFISIIVAIIYSKKSIQQDIQKGTIELFQEFNGERFKSIRGEAWKVKEKWYNEKNYRKRFLDYNLNIADRKTNKELDKDIGVIYELLEFYLIVSSYDGNQQILRSLRYFYYGWWRPFLYDIGGEIEKNRGINPILFQTKNEYIDNISYVKNLEKLDEICGLQKIAKDIEIHYDGG